VEAYHAPATAIAVLSVFTLVAGALQSAWILNSACSEFDCARDHPRVWVPEANDWCNVRTGDAGKWCLRNIPSLQCNENYSTKFCDGTYDKTGASCPIIIYEC